MKNLNQWITWNPVPVPGTSRINKVPCDPGTRLNINHHDPKNWMDYSTAKKHDPTHIGIILTTNDPYFCIDLDDALVNGAWSDYALGILARFNGAYCEVSFSGTGLHLFGRTSHPIPKHKNKCRGENIELYTSNQFIAFSEINAKGNYGIDFSKELETLIAEKFTPPVALKPEPITTGGVDPDWLGPEDDDELIKIMLDSKQSKLAMLNGVPTIQDLWNENLEVLKASYPSDKDTYDRSSADLALFTHLGFWTGKNHVRMERIARRSALKRDKWDSHVGYLGEFTILKACSSVTKVYQNPKMLSEIGGSAHIRQADEMLDIHRQKIFFKGCVYIISDEKILTPRRGILGTKAFDAAYGGSIFELSTDWKKSTKKASEAFIHSTIHRFPKTDKSVFRPDLEYGEITESRGMTGVNTYKTAAVVYTDGNVDNFLYLTKKLFPIQRDYDIALSYAAACVQYPGVKFRWCIVLQGFYGNGKTMFMDCIADSVGNEYVSRPLAHNMGSTYNEWLDRKIFVIINELKITNRSVGEILKPLISDKAMSVQQKYEDLREISNVANFGITTNHRDALKEFVKDRRYCIFYTPQQKKEDNIKDGLVHEFFKKFGLDLDNGGRGHIAGFLKRFPIKDEFNPATTVFTAPKTSKAKEILIANRGSAHQEIEDAIEQELYGFRNGWVSSHPVGKLLEYKGLRGSTRSNQLTILMNDIGYVKNPWTKGGRSTKILDREGSSKPILYIKESMVHEEVLACDVSDLYRVAQIEPNLGSSPMTPPPPVPMTPPQGIV